MPNNPLMPGALGGQMHPGPIQGGNTGFVPPQQGGSPVPTSLPPGAMTALGNQAGMVGMQNGYHGLAPFMQKFDGGNGFFGDFRQHFQDYRNALMDWRGQMPDNPASNLQAFQDWRSQRPDIRTYFFGNPPVMSPGPGGAPIPGPTNQQPAPQQAPVVSQTPVNPAGMVGTTMGVIGATGGGNGQLPTY